MSNQHQHGGLRPGSGRKKRTEKGLEEAIQFSGKVEKSIAQKCKQYYGTYANALRFAANKIENDNSLQ